MPQGCEPTEACGCRRRAAPNASGPGCSVEHPWSEAIDGNRWEASASEVRASIVAMKPSNVGGAKGRREMDAG